MFNAVQWPQGSSFSWESVKEFLSRLPGQDLSFLPDALSLVPKIAWMIAGLLVLVLALSRVPVRRKYANPLVEFARKFGFRFQEDHDYFLEHDLRPFAFSGLGRVSPRIYYVLAAINDKGVHFKLFDFNATRLKFGIPRFQGQTMGYAGIPGKFFPHVLIAPKTLYWCFRLHGARDRFVTEGIPGRFLQKYVVVLGKDEPLPKFKPELFDKILHWNNAYSLEIKNDRLIFFRRGQVIPLREMIVFYKRLQDIADVFIQAV